MCGKVQITVSISLIGRCVANVMVNTALLPVRTRAFREGVNWLQIELKDHLMTAQLALGRNMNASQQYEVGVMAKLLQS